MASNVTAPAKGSSGHVPSNGNGDAAKVNPAILAAADAISTRVVEHATEIREAQIAADGAADARGFADNLKAAVAINLTLAELTAWKPQRIAGTADVNPVEAAMRQVHDIAAPDHGPSARKLMATALQAAVNASGIETAEQARVGLGDKDRPQFKMVPLRTTGANKPGVHKSMEEARAELDGMAENGIGNGFVTRAVAAIDNPQLLRQLAASLGAAQTRARRWRSTVFLPLISENLENYEASNPSTPIGQVWQPAAEKAKAAHEAVMKDVPEGQVADADALAEAIEDAVTEFLAEKLLERVKAPSKPSMEETINSAVGAIYANLRKLRDHDAISEDDHDTLKDQFDGALTAVNPKLVDPREVAAKLKAQAENDAAEARLAKLREKEAATAQRKAEAEARKKAEADAKAAEVEAAKKAVEGKADGAPAEDRAGKAARLAEARNKLKKGAAKPAAPVAEAPFKETADFNTAK